jgi:tetratricopeptide repeat protein 30
MTSATVEAAKEALSDMPPRAEEELDPVSLHNQALIHMEDDPNGAIRKLDFLLQQTSCPPETFGTWLCSVGRVSCARLLMAEGQPIS